MNNILWKQPSIALLERLYSLNYSAVAEWETADDFAAYLWCGTDGVPDTDEVVIRTAKAYWACCRESARAAAEGAL